MATPLMLLTAIAVILDGPGPVLDRQERIGLRGRVFTRLKFRSVRPDAERDGVAHGVRKRGARITRVGASSAAAGSTSCLSFSASWRET